MPTPVCLALRTAGTVLGGVPPANIVGYHLTLN